MIKQTHAYRAALVLLADALARQDPAGVIGYIRGGSVISDLTDVMHRRIRRLSGGMRSDRRDAAPASGLRCCDVCQG